MNNWGKLTTALISYGHIGADLIRMRSMLRIPVAMHNVPEDDIYRPAAMECIREWQQKEGADFRASRRTDGPLYK